MDIHTSQQPMKTYSKALLYKIHHSVIRKCESGGEEVLPFHQSERVWRSGKDLGGGGQGELVSEYWDFPW